MSEQINLFDANADYFDGTDDNIDYNKLNFKVHASLIYKLGESLITDEITALSELMKNSYDADASFCSLIIDPEHVDQDGIVGKIEISDNGTGMDLKTILNGWLTISNSQKKKMKKENRTTDIFNRIPLGEKGLGRLSVQKLGRRVVLVTKIKESHIENTLEIPWEEFLQNTTLDKINLTCSQKEVFTEKSYTKIIITSLINPDFWKSEEVRKDLEKTINKIISPFRFENNNFIISAKVGNFKIDISNALFNDVLKTARSKYTFSVDEKKVTITNTYKIDFFKKRNIGNDYPNFDFSRDYFKELFGILKKNFQNIQYLESESEVYSIKMELPFEGFSVLKRTSSGDLLYPGNFDGSIYDFSFDKNYITEIVKNNDFVYALKENEYREYIKSNKGIKVIRDGFVVQGYGDGNLDWLNISSSATTSGRYSDLRNENLIGYIRLSGKNNQSLKETTSREGFIADEYYHNFYSIIRELVIKKINKANEELTDALKQYLNSLLIKSDPALNFPLENIKKISEKTLVISNELKEYSAQVTAKVTPMIAKAIEESTQISFTPYSEREKYTEIIEEQSRIISELTQKFQNYIAEVDGIKSSVNIINRDFEKYNQRIGDVFELAGLGISVELFTHELYTTINNVNEKIKNSNNITEELPYISNAMNSLRKQLSYFHPGLKYVRMKKEKILLSRLVLNHIEFYKKQAENKKIVIVLSDNSLNLTIYANVGLLNQVLDNIFSNSVHWLQYSRDNLKIIDRCEYNICINSDGSLDIWDNGIGVSQSIETDVFNPFVSCKESGRGLGLFISKSNLENNSASIRLARDRNDFGNLFKFHIDLSNLAESEV